MRTLRILLASALLLLGASCSKDEHVRTAEEGNAGFLVSAAFGEGSTKTTLSGMSPLWSEGDMIKVYNSDGTRSQTVTLVTDGTPSTTVGVITGGGAGCSFRSAFGGTIYAVYPESSAAGVSNGRPVISIPSQTDGSFGRANICAATASVSGAVSSMTFRNAVTILQVNDKSASIEKFVIGQEGRTFCGSFEVDGLSGETLSLVNATGTGSMVSVKGMSQSGPYYVAIAPVETAAGVLSRYYSSEDAVEGEEVSSKSVAKLSLAIRNMYRIGVASPASIGLFSISQTSKVAFAPGNLYYTAADGKLRFECNQWYYRHVSGLTDDSAVLGADGETAQTPEGTVGSFRWGSLEDAITTGKENPTSDFFAAGNVAVDASPYQWRALTKDDWTYLLSTRKVSVGGKSKTSYGLGVVNGVKGLILLPDDWDGSVCPSFTYEKSSWVNEFTWSTSPRWSDMERAGCVFLPAAGYRNPGVKQPGAHGNYWTSTENDGTKAYYLNFSTNFIGASSTYDYRYGGTPLRLTRAVQE